MDKQKHRLVINMLANGGRLYSLPFSFKYHIMSEDARKLTTIQVKTLRSMVDSGLLVKGEVENGLQYYVLTDAAKAIANNS